MPEHVTTKKLTKDAVSLPKKKMNLLPEKQGFDKVPIYSIKYIKKETFNLYVDNRIKENFENLFCPKCESEMCPHISTKRTSSFYDCINCKTSCHALNI